jgi:hypothetical protein
MHFTRVEGRLREEAQLSSDQIFLRIGGACAILGAIFSVASGVGFGNLTNESVVETVLPYLASRPRWYWPVVHLGFIFGALLWVGAFLALARSFTNGVSRALGWLGVVCIIIGAAIHVVDSSLSGFGLAALAFDWASAPSSDQTNLIGHSQTLLRVLSGVWSTVLMLFHGLPFVLSGLAVSQSRSYPRWIGWIGVFGGVGSLFAGLLMFLGADIFPSWLFIGFALIVSIWMTAMGILMWRRTVGEAGSSGFQINVQ